MNGIKDYIESLKDGKGYYWISKHGTELNKYELIDIIKEFDYAIHSMGIRDGKEDLYNAVYENLSYAYEEE